jgi:biopolymer transport protein ExbD
MQFKIYVSIIFEQITKRNSYGKQKLPLFCYIFATFKIPSLLSNFILYFMPSYRFGFMSAILLPILLWATWQSSLHTKATEIKTPKDSLVEPISPITPTIRVSRQGAYYWNQRQAQDSLVYKRIEDYLHKNPKQTIILKADKLTTVERVLNLTAYINAQGGKVVVATLPDTTLRKVKNE